MKRTTSAYMEYLLRTPSCTTVPGRVIPNTIEGGRNRVRFTVTVCEPIIRYPVISGSDDENEYEHEEEYAGETGNEHTNHAATFIHSCIYE
jgi:hypothetical protein